MILDFLKIAIKNISKRKLRTFLTILGIVVAISAILSLLLLSNGLENSIESEFDKIGSNRIFLTSEGGLESNLAVSSLSEKDIKVVIVLAWNFFDYIVDKNKSLIEKGVRFISIKELEDPNFNF